MWLLSYNFQFLGESPTYTLDEDTHPGTRAIGVSHTACKDEFRRNLRRHVWSVPGILFNVHIEEKVPMDFKLYCYETNLPNFAFYSQKSERKNDSREMYISSVVLKEPHVRCSSTLVGVCCGGLQVIRGHPVFIPGSQLARG